MFGRGSKIIEGTVEKMHNYRDFVTELVISSGNGGDKIVYFYGGIPEFGKGTLIRMEETKSGIVFKEVHQRLTVDGQIYDTRIAETHKYELLKFPCLGLM